MYPSVFQQWRVDSEHGQWLSAIAIQRKLILELRSHLLYGITQCYLPPDTGERAPLVLDLPTLEGWKTELI